jgi:Fic family protein
MAKNYYQIKEQAEFWLKDKLDESRIVFKKTELSKSIYKYLDDNSFLVDLHANYFFIKTDDHNALEAFKLQYWKILVQFLNLRFPTKDGNPSWYLTGKYAYEFMVDRVLVPELNDQITVQTKASSNTVIDLFKNHRLIISTDKKIEEKTIIRYNVNGDNLHLLKPEYTIVNSDPTQYRLYEENIVAFMKNKDFDYDYLVDYFKRNQSPIYHARFIGALRQIDEKIQAIKFEELFKYYDFKVAIENPFSRDYQLKRSAKPTYSTRFAISMKKARDYLSCLNLPACLGKKIDKDDIDNLAENDAYHSLTIEAYDVTQEIIHKINEGEDVDSDLRNKTAVKGFIRVLSFIKSIVGKDYEITQDLTEELWKELWSPSINAGLFDFEIDVYRKRPVYIRNSLSVPPSHEKIYYLLEEFYDQIGQIDNGFQQGIFAHFFYVWIHPHLDGNGRISRFLMNLAFIKGGYKWLTIKHESRREYFKALERSQIEDDISYFAEFILKSYEI